MTKPTYTAEDANRDRREIDRLLSPVVDAVLADLGLTLDEALAMIRAGLPCPKPLAVRREDAA